MTRCDRVLALLAFARALRTPVAPTIASTRRGGARNGAQRFGRDVARTATIDDATLLSRVAPVVAAPADGCRLERLAVGNTNQLYALATNDAKYLVRVFGENAALAFDRRRENDVFAELSERGLAPPLIGLFEGGRVEGWLDGRPATADECRDDAATEVAAALGRLHAEGPVSPGRPWAITTAETWLVNARARRRNFLDETSDYARRVRAIDLDAIAAVLDDLRAALPPEGALRFCHNDLSNTNVHLRDDGGVSLIDFESPRRGTLRATTTRRRRDRRYGGPNYRGFDLSTHLSHWAGGAVDGRYDDAAWPDAAARRRFVDSYCAAAGADASEIEREIAQTLPLAHAVWGLWAVCSLPDQERAPFSHIEYAERRLGACLRRSGDATRSRAADATETRADDATETRADDALDGLLNAAIAALGAAVAATTVLNLLGFGWVFEDGSVHFDSLAELQMRATLAGG